jgi:hypothetical protein
VNPQRFNRPSYVTQRLKQPLDMSVPPTFEPSQLQLRLTRDSKCMTKTQKRDSGKVERAVGYAPRDEYEGGGMPRKGGTATSRSSTPSDRCVLQRGLLESFEVLAITGLSKTGLSNDVN